MVELTDGTFMRPSELTIDFLAKEENSKIINVNISSLIDKVSISKGEDEESYKRICELLRKTLIDVVRDFEYAYVNSSSLE